MLGPPTRSPGRKRATPVREADTANPRRNTAAIGAFFGFVGKAAFSFSTAMFQIGQPGIARVNPL